MRITELYRYPVKSMLGESMITTEVGSNGFAGDRAWALRKGNATVSGKKYPALMSAAARFDDQPTTEHGSARATISLPTGARVSTTDSKASEQLSTWLGEDIKLWPLVSADNLDFFRREANTNATPEQMEKELRHVFSRLPDEPLPDLQTWPAEILQYDSPPGTYFDAYPLLLISQSAVATLKKNAENDFDMRRFRPNIVLDDELIQGLSENGIDQNDEFPENALAGQHCEIGEVVLSVDMACPRCIMTTHPIAELPKDPGIMRKLVAHNAGNLGVYARVIKTGKINVGDTLRVTTSS